MCYLQGSAGASDSSSAISAISSVSADSVKALAKSITSSPLAVAAVGNTTYIPSYTKITKQFQ